MTKLEVKVKEKKIYHIEEVDMQCTAIADGYFGGRIIKAGSQFKFDAILKDGNFPRWVEPVDQKFESEFSKLDEEDELEESMQHAEDHSGEDFGSADLSEPKAPLALASDVMNQPSPQVDSII